MESPGVGTDTLRQFGLGAVALVVVSALLFALVGLVSDDGDGGDPVAQPSATADPSDDPTDGPTSSPTDVGTDPVVAPTDGATDQPTDTPTDTPTAVASDLDAAKGMSIQVLDGVLTDSRGLHGRVVSCLQDAGFTSLITQNNSSRVYDATAVFYTPNADGSNQAAAEAIAAEFGFTRAEEKPDTLSDSVPLHIVVGTDATSPC